MPRRIAVPVWIRRLGLAALLIVPTPVVGADTADRGRKAFIETNRCAIVERLDSIHRRGPRSTSADRFLVAVPDGAPDRYVQCIFFDDDTRMVCEASSGRYGGTVDLLDAPGIAALEALGFTLDDPNGNFAREIALGTPANFNRVAELMLGALHDGYGVRSGDPLLFDAPMARLPRDACPGPVS